MTGTYRRAALAAILALAAAACTQTPPTRFYVLTPAAADAAAVSSRTLVVGLEPVDLPGYLNRPQIVTRAAPVRHELGELDQWAEPLDAMVTRVLAESIYRLAPARSVQILPRRRGDPPERIVEVSVRRFDVDAAASAVLEADWAIFEGEDRRLAGSRFQAEVPVPASGDHQAMVGAMSECLDLLAREIAQALAAS